MGIRDLTTCGSDLLVRGERGLEILNRVTHLTEPCERCLFLPKRGNSVFAAIAETMWVIKGRNDIQWLETYLPRARSFSDDGVVWRAAYGPRLRNWHGIDQLDEVRKLLLAETATRRAVINLFDPAADFVSSKDIPCTNWLHWIVRDGKLHLNIALRSNDVIWGFSGVNAFEWSVLHEMMASWIGVAVGSATYFASSFHLYARHYDRANAIVDGYAGLTCYDFGIRPPPFQTGWLHFDDALSAWFERETQFRASPELPASELVPIADPLLEQLSELLRIYQGAKQGWSIDRLRKELGALQETDFAAAAYDYFSRRNPEVLDAISQPSIRAFFKALSQRTTIDIPEVSMAALKSHIKALHREKDTAYARAWKRRGELISILPNISRKSDRLEAFLESNSQLADETLLDTAIDLLVYILKYRLFLMELMSEAGEHELPTGAPVPYSDHSENFDAMLNACDFLLPIDVRLTDQAVRIQELCRQLYTMVSSAPEAVEQRAACARLLATAALKVLVAVYAQSPSFHPPTLDKPPPKNP